MLVQLVVDVNTDVPSSAKLPLILNNRLCRVCLNEVDFVFESHQQGYPPIPVSPGEQCTTCGSPAAKQMRYIVRPTGFVSYLVLVPLETCYVYKVQDN